VDNTPITRFPKRPSYDPTKTVIYLKVFWETEYLKDRMEELGRSNASCRGRGSEDKVIGVMISHMGRVYNLLSKYILYI